MKIKHSNIVKIFKSIVNSKLVAISLNKELLVQYMEYHRQLKRKEYKIIDENIEEAHLYDSYGDFIITNFYNIAIPNIDQMIILEEYGDLYTDMHSIINKLRYYAFLCNRDDKTKKDFGIVLDAIKFFEKIQNSSKKSDRLLKNHLLCHPIIKCNMDEYNKMISRYRENKYNIERYKYLCDND